MPRLSSSARALAAGNLTGVSGPPPDFADVGAESAEAGAPAMPKPSLEEGLSMLESALADLSPEKAERARSHLEALRAIIAEEESEPKPEAPPVAPEEGEPTVAPEGA